MELMKTTMLFVLNELKTIWDWLLTLAVLAMLMLFWLFQVERRLWRLKKRVRKDCG